MTHLTFYDIENSLTFKFTMSKQADLQLGSVLNSNRIFDRVKSNQINTKSCN